jgi:hypothetical protein
MNGLQNSTYFAGYIISNIIGLLILWTAIKKPALARLMLVLIFGWACGLNYFLAHQKPEAYLNYADTSIKWYADFIHGWFRQHITEMVSLIAIGEGLIAVGMILKGWWVKLACMGVIIFQLSIAPLGVYAAFPFSITVSVAAFFILRKNRLDYLWKYRLTKRNKEIIYK